MSGAIDGARLRDPPLRPIAEKVDGGRAARRRPTGVALYATTDLLGLGTLADFANRRRNGDRVFFSANQHINPTNVCILRNTCVFCSFARMPKEDGAYTRSLEEVFHEAEQARGMPTREFHIVGGLHPKLRLSYYTDMIRGLKERHPAGAHQGAHRGRDRAPGADREDRPSARCCIAMKEAGLTSLPGGGAEVFSTAVRATIAERKLTGEEWLRVHRVAHELGIPTNCTMLYGHVETAEDRIAHLSQLRALQDETGGFLTYIPLAYHPDHNELGEEMGRVGTATTGYEDLKNIAVAPALPRQHSAREDPLAHGDAVPLADRARLRLRRRRGHRGLRADLSRGRRAHRHAPAVSRAGAADPRSGEAAGRARQPLSGGARPVRRSAARALACGGARRCRWCTPHEARPHSLDQLLSGLRRHRPRAGRACRPSW